MTLEEILAKNRDGTLPGIYPDVPNSVYHNPKCPGISKSRLDKVAQSIGHYYLSLEEKEDSSNEDLLLGSAYHDSILLPEYFDSTYVAHEFDNKMTSANCNLKRTESTEKNPGKIPIDLEIMERVLKMREVTLNHPIASKLIGGATYEQSAWWVDQETGVLCKCRPDILRVDDTCIVDLKTTAYASYLKFRRSVVDYNYDKQAAFYLDGLSEVFKQKFKFFAFIAVEKVEPFGVAIYNTTEEMLNTGRSLYKRDLLTYKQAIENGLRSYPQEIQPIHLPLWARDIDSRG